MNIFPSKKNLPTTLVLIALLFVLVFIYVKPQSVTSNFDDIENNLDHIIYSNDYQLNLTPKEEFWLKHNPTIKLGIDRAFPPFGFINSDFEYQGFSADFMRIIAHRLNIKFDIDHHDSWNDTVRKAKSGQIDMIAAIVKTKPREQFLNFTKPYASNPTVIVSAALEKGFIGSLHNLVGKTVAVEKGSYAYDELNRRYPKIKLIPVKNTNLALSLVSSELADAYVGNSVTASHLIKKYGYQTLTFSGETEYTSTHSIGVQKNNEILLGIMEKALASIDAETRGAVTDHWFHRTDNKTIDAKTLVKVGVSFLGLLLLLLAWTLSLRKARNDLAHSQQLLERETELDRLTGLGNRRKFYRFLDKEINTSEKSDTSFALFLIDFDNFKEINDMFGHSVGDLVIIEAAKRIESCLNDADKLTRLGSDEFMVIVSDIKTRSSLDRYAKKILSNISNKFFIDENEINTSASIGVTCYPFDANRAEQLLINADQAMFHSKRLGKNRFSHFNYSMRNDSILRSNTIKDLRIALQENQFELNYQPIIDLKTNKIVKAEALIRWNHPQRGLITPDNFIPLAEETGIIIDIGEWVFKEAVAETVRFVKLLGNDFQMSINTSPLQFGASGLNVSDWFSHIIRSGLSGKNISLEITEGLLMESNDTVRNKLYNLSDLDIQTSIDDFGTGYSSLSYLKRFHIDYLKIDRSFVKNIDQENAIDDKILVETIIVMAHKLGCKVIAEGISNDDQQQILIDEGCDYAQGYHVAKPLSAKDFISFVHTWQDIEEDEDSKNVLPFNKPNSTSNSEQ